MIGYSVQYNGTTTAVGRSAWIYDHGATTILGLTDMEHTGSDGVRHSDPSALNNAGQVAGSSWRYSGTGSDLGASAWIYDHGMTTKIGLTNEEHTGSGGVQYSHASALNAAGQVIGGSYRYSATGNDLGATAWLYNHGTTTKIGLTDPDDTEHTGSDGYQYNRAHFLNDAGHVVGEATRCEGTNHNLGTSLWFYNGSTTAKIGLTDEEHTTDNGYKRIQAWSLNAAGQVIGTSERFRSSETYYGQSAWIFNGSATTKIGLLDAEHTGSNDFQYSFAMVLNDAGQAIGYSQRFSSTGDNLGDSAWFYNGSTTTKIGLTDDGYTRSDGYKKSWSSSLNAAGQVIGYSERYSDATYLGQTAWFFDSDQNQLHSLVFSQQSNGYSFSSAEFLSDDGIVLGYYKLYDSSDQDLGDRAFYWSLTGGFYDLGAIVDGGLAANGWDWLHRAFQMNGVGQIFGYGKLTAQSSGQMPYMIEGFSVATVPEPSAVATLLLGMVGLFMWKRRE